MSKDITPAVPNIGTTQSNGLTEDQFKKVLPKQFKGKVSADIVDNINNIIKDPIIKESYRDNLLGYAGVMKSGKFRLDQYIDAVRYVSFKLLGSTNIEAYTKTFPDRLTNFIQNGTSDKDIASYVTSYNKNKLVNLILEQTLVPVHVLNADLYQKAINVQAELMVHATSEKVRTDAANSILTQLKAPEVSKIELDITHKEDGIIDELRRATQDLVNAEKLAIKSGSKTVLDIAHSELNIIDAEIVD